ncbi:MAG: hypothetical protein ACYCTZ_04445 [Candidatus Dormibacteria bacterium]
MASVMAQTIAHRGTGRTGSQGRVREGKGQPRVDPIVKAWAALDAARLAEARALLDLSAAQERARNATETCAAAWKDWNRARGGEG